jgi:carotenoid cleavage dioxygenase-like enzyme
VPASIIMGPTLEHNEESGDQEMNEEYFSRLYEWRLNLKTKAVAGEWLTGTDVAMEYPFINDKYVGLHHRYAYAQVVNVQGSMAGGCGTGNSSKHCNSLLYMQQEVGLLHPKTYIASPKDFPNLT